MHGLLFGFLPAASHPIPRMTWSRSTSESALAHKGIRSSVHFAQLMFVEFPKHSFPMLWLNLPCFSSQRISQDCWNFPFFGDLPLRQDAWLPGWLPDSLRPSSSRGPLDATHWLLDPGRSGRPVDFEMGQVIFLSFSSDVI